MDQVTKVFDLYGVLANSIEDACSAVERAIGERLNAHESGYRGGDYYRLHDVGQEHFILQRNFDEFDGEWFEVDFQDMPFILYVNETGRSGDLREALTAQPCISLLRHEEVSSMG
jgi:hypothetical protein